MLILKKSIREVPLLDSLRYDLRHEWIERESLWWEKEAKKERMRTEARNRNSVRICEDMSAIMPVTKSISSIFGAISLYNIQQSLVLTHQRCPWRWWRGSSRVFLAVNTKMHVSEQKFNVRKYKIMRLDESYRLVTTVLVLNSHCGKIDSIFLTIMLAAAR
jgi:hypothetical protein